MKTKIELSRVEKFDKKLQKWILLLKASVGTVVFILVFQGLVGLTPWIVIGKITLYIGAITGVVVLFFKLVYKLIGEKIECEILRKKSAEVLTDTGLLPMLRQVSGPQRVGKDLSVVGSANIMRELIMVKDAKKMKELRDKLFMIDFDKVHEYLDILHYGHKFVQSSEKKIMSAFISTMSQNECFIDGEYSKSNQVTGLEFLKDYIKGRKSTMFYKDGITPGGKQYLDLLFEYFIYYVRYVHIPNYILSNQPIIEVLKLDKNQQIQELVMSKKFKQSMIAIKEDNSFPFIHSMIVIETESAIFNGNVDKKNEAYVKHISGIREFFTLIGHLLGESSYYYTVTQDPMRQIKAVRELHLCYMHVMGKTERCTSPNIRKLIGFYIGVFKLNNWFIKKFFEYALIEWTEVKTWYKNMVTAPFKLALLAVSQITKTELGKVFLNKARQLNRKIISKAKALQDRLNAKGYLEFQIGVYRSIKDVGRRVTFPKLLQGVMVEDSGDFNSRSFGLCLTMRKSDTFGRYNTHYLKIIRTAKTDKHSETFKDLPTWDSMDMKLSDVEYMGYKPLQDIMDELISVPKIFMSEEERYAKNIKLLTQMSVDHRKKFTKLISKAGLMKHAKVIARKISSKPTTTGKATWNKLTPAELFNQLFDRGLVDKASLEFCAVPVSKEYWLSTNKCKMKVRDLLMNNEIVMRKTLNKELLQPSKLIF